VKWLVSNDVCSKKEFNDLLRKWQSNDSLKKFIEHLRRNRRQELKLHRLASHYYYVKKIFSNFFEPNLGLKTFYVSSSCVRAL
jgi:transcriptional regulator GlxA family with amidase domain